MNYNLVILAGHVVKDADYREFPDGGKICTYRLAVNREYKNRAGEYEADFFNITTSGKVAEWAKKYAVKGQGLLVQGSLKTRNWQDEDKKWNNLTEVSVFKHKFTGVKKDSDRAPEMETQQTMTQMQDDDGDEIPF